MALLSSRNAEPTLTSDQRNAFIGGFLGWTMDAYDYFLVVLVYAEIGKEFHAGRSRNGWPNRTGTARRSPGR